ncbi:MAG: hypothetical protein K2I25_05840, partial [Muribaculaceae bacterium]|nr:hypothetical protein [Muribaculaceae bacterium]
FFLTSNPPYPNLRSLVGCDMCIRYRTAIDDVGPNIARGIIDFFADERNCTIVERLRESGLTLATETIDEAPASDILSGKSIVISGTFDRHSRDEYKQIIEHHGGKNTGSISKKTDMILAGENMGPSKLEKAKALNIPIVDEISFLQMIGEE